MTFLRSKRSAFFALLGAATLSLVLGGVAGGQPLTVETFTGTTVADPSAWVAGGSGGIVNPGWPGEACLTAGTDTAQNPIAGCGLGTPDAAGAGALRITPATTARAGFALYNSPLPTTGGLDITFKQSQWGGSGADGIAFFLVNGTTNLTQPGQAGGALGYGSNGGASPGVANALIGVGIDSWGNFANTGSAGTGCAAGTGAGSAGPGPSPDRVVVRGPGNGTVGYCFLGMSAVLAELNGATRAQGTRTVRVVFDPDTVATRNVTVYLDGVQVVQVPAPPELLAVTTFKFGFGAATGDVTNNNEVWDLNIESVNPVTPPAPVPTGPTFTG